MKTTENQLEALRVAHAELLSGNTDGDVYIQASPGAAMYLTDRTLAVNQVSNQIRSVMKGDFSNDTPRNPAEPSKSQWSNMFFSVGLAHRHLLLITSTYMLSDDRWSKKTVGSCTWRLHTLGILHRIQINYNSSDLQQRVARSSLYLISRVYTRRKGLRMGE